MSITIPHYHPAFLQKFWLTYGSHGPIHRYDLYTTELFEMTLSAGVYRGDILAGVDATTLYGATKHSYEIVCNRFNLLERQTETVLEDIIRTTRDSTSTMAIPVDRSKIDILLKYFSFLRFRNSPEYSATVREIMAQTLIPPTTRLGMYNDVFQHFTWGSFFKSIYAFLCSEGKYLPSYDADFTRTVFSRRMGLFCWDILRGGDVYVGVTSNEQEYILPERCFGMLDESLGTSEPVDDAFFFPIIPSLALYIIGSEREKWPSPGLTVIEVDHETEIDIHLRNAMVLNSMSPDPDASMKGAKLYFSSLFSITRSILSYEEFRFRDSLQFIDYSRLKQRCRQKYLQATVTKMLIVKDNVKVIDLTDDVEFGDEAIAFGAFSDVFKGKWYDRMERKERVVAIKFLRKAMAKDVSKNKLLKRLQGEVVTWHNLCHRNISQLFGIVETKTGVGMVSAWCKNATVGRYLKDINPDANRIALLRQIASGVSYLHSFKPPIVHGDLKGGNILVDEHGQAIITDFGLSKVMSDLSDAVCSSFFAGSTRWMAPELIDALVSDEERVPQVTTASDVYAFASVCLEIITGNLPYPNRKNDQAVMVDIMRRIKPYRGSPSGWSGCHSEPFVVLLERCWGAEPAARPCISEVLGVLTASVS